MKKLTRIIITLVLVGGGILTVFYFPLVFPPQDKPPTQLIYLLLKQPEVPSTKPYQS